MQKLPKQWRHWCQVAGLKRYWSRGKDGRKDHQWFYLKGHGRVWRLNCHAMLQCGDRLEEFDRWALCSIIEVPMPTSLNEFVEAVRTLLNEADSAAE